MVAGFPKASGEVRVCLRLEKPNKAQLFDPLIVILS